MVNIDALLAIEEDNHLWDIEAEGLKLWPLIRFEVLNSLVIQEKSAITSSQEGRSVYFLRKKWPRYFRTLLSLFSLRPKRFSMLFMINDLARLNQDQHSYDQLFGELYKRIADPLIIQSSPRSFYPQPDAHFENQIFSLDVFWLLAVVLSKSRRLSPSTQQTITEFARQVAGLYNMPEQRLGGYLSSFVREYPVMKRLISAYVSKRVKTRLAVVSEASYLGRTALLTKILHDLSFTVVELQHGLIDPSNFAYHLPALCFEQTSQPAKPYLPDTLLTFGDYWSQITVSPVEKIAIGYPNLSQKAAEFLQNPLVPRQILVLSQFVITEKVAQLAEALARAFPDRSIVFKLHPLEVNSPESFASLQGLPNVKIVGRENVYRYVAESEVIVSFWSTVLIEALMFPNKRIFYSDRVVIPEVIGDYFETPDELIALIKDPQRGQPHCAPQDFWADDWRERLGQFLITHLPSQSLMLDK